MSVATASPFMRMNTSLLFVAKDSGAGATLLNRSPNSLARTLPESVFLISAWSQDPPPSCVIARWFITTSIQCWWIWTRTWDLWAVAVEWAATVLSTDSLAICQKFHSVVLLLGHGCRAGYQAEGDQ